MEILSAVVLSLIFLVLSGLHFYWVGGGKWGLALAVPTTGPGKSTFEPGPLATLAVALGLLALSVWALAFLWLGPGWNWLAWVVAGVFFLRSVGDFRFVGWFKTIRDTPFGKMDSRLYSPLCLFISLLQISIIVL